MGISRQPDWPRRCFPRGRGARHPVVVLLGHKKSKLLMNSGLDFLLVGITGVFGEKYCAEDSLLIVVLDRLNISG